MSANPVSLLLVATVLACGSGCAKSDWIDRTLVTAEVSGVWERSGVRAPSGPLEVRLELQQEGPKVRGNVYLERYATHSQTGTSGPVEGSVEDDVLKFHQTNGSVRAEMTVAGDEMTGFILAGINYQVSLHHVSSTLPGSP